MQHLTIKWETSPGLAPYLEAIAAMEEHVAGIIAGTAPEMVWLLEHPPLYTAGTSAKPTDLIEPERFPVYTTGRGGQYTYHGPGIRIAYVMLDLKKQAAPHAPDIRQYVFNLEQWIINTLARLGIKGERRQGRVGIWVVDNAGKEAKIAALGIRVRRWVSFHGIAINVSPDLSHFNGIIPCGISQYGVTSLHALGAAITMKELDNILQEEFFQIFHIPLR